MTSPSNVLIFLTDHSYIRIFTSSIFSILVLVPLFYRAITLNTPVQILTPWAIVANQVFSHSFETFSTYIVVKRRPPVRMGRWKKKTEVGKFILNTPFWTGELSGTLFYGKSESLPTCHALFIEPGPWIKYLEDGVLEVGCRYNPTWKWWTWTKTWNILKLNPLNILATKLMFLRLTTMDNNGRWLRLWQRKFNNSTPHVRGNCAHLTEKAEPTEIIKKNFLGWLFFKIIIRAWKSTY